MTRCGMVAIIGRPNVGKSTLMNHILGQKISITCDKPQTTRHQILGIKTEKNVQTIFVDTPGLHQNVKKALNRTMNKAALAALHDVDLVVWVMDHKWTAEEQWIAERLKDIKTPVVGIINKIDLYKKKTDLLPILESRVKQYPFDEIIPISAEKGQGVVELETLIAKYLPEQPFIYAEDQLTNKSERFLVAEIIREKLMRMLGDELPYAVTVSVEQFNENAETGQIEIFSTIWVERASQKSIIIGRQGQKIKTIGMLARQDINTLLGKRSHLELWVKVKSGWSDDERALRSLGYDHEE